MVEQDNQNHSRRLQVMAVEDSKEDKVAAED
jgi:hypothetical protein